TLTASEAIVDLAFSPDSRHLAMSFAGTGNVDLFQTATGKPLRTLSADGKLPSGNLLAFSPDGKRLAVATQQGQRSIMVWDVQTGERLLWGSGDLKEITQLTFASESLLLAGQPPPAEIQSWKIEGQYSSEKPVRAKGFGLKGSLIAFSPDGKV